MSDFKNKKLKRIFYDCLDRLDEYKDFPWENKYAYGQWLAQTYFFVRHTTSFLALASSRYGHWQRDRQYHLLGHLREEAGHDKMVLDDLKKLGFDISDFTELPETAAFYQAQYYYIEHENPIAHFGYSLWLEGIAAKKLDPVYRRLEKRFAPEACRFLHLHCVVDKDHFDQGLKAFDDITPEEADYIGRNLIQSCTLYLHILEHIKKLTLSRDGKKSG